MISIFLVIFGNLKGVLNSHFEGQSTQTGIIKLLPGTKR